MTQVRKNLEFVDTDEAEKSLLRSIALRGSKNVGSPPRIPYSLSNDSQNDNERDSQRANQTRFSRALISRAMESRRFSKNAQSTKPVNFRYAVDSVTESNRVTSTPYGRYGSVQYGSLQGIGEDDVFVPDNRDEPLKRE
eukprot:10830752-Ditylum_brightwellii.AAC.1